MKNFITAIPLIKNYQKENLSGDLSAGFTIGMLLIPQGMAYAILAGLPVEYGLYGALIPPLIYFLFGTAQRLVVGPAALDSILLASGMAVLSVANEQDYVEKVMLIVFMAGIFQILAGMLKLGFLTNFFSKPLLKSFISASAILIGLSQLKHVLGISIPRSSYIHEVIIGMINEMPHIKLWPLVIGVCTIAYIRIFGKIGLKKIATPSILVLMLILSYYFGFDKHGIAVVEKIPSGLPEFKLVNFSAGNFFELLPTSILLGLMGFTLSMSISKQVEKEPNKVIANKEFIALGISNVVGSFFGAYQSDSSFSRTAINKQSGANTRVSNLVSSALITIVLLFLTPLFYYLPKAVLGGVIIAAIPSLIDFKYFQEVYKTDKKEFYVMVLIFLTTLEFGIIAGILFGVLLSIILFLYKTSKPHIAVLGYIKGRNIFKNVDRFHEAKQTKGQLIIRVDSPLYFSNIRNVLDTIEERINNEHFIHFLIIDGSSITSVDVTVLDELNSFCSFLTEKKIHLVLSGFIGPVRDKINSNPLKDKLFGKQIFLQLPEASNYCLKHKEMSGYGFIPHD